MTSVCQQTQISSARSFVSKFALSIVHVEKRMRLITFKASGFCGRVVCVLGYSAGGCGFEPRRDLDCGTGLYPPKVTCHQAGICAKSLVPAGKL